MPFPSSLSTASEQPFQHFLWQHLAPTSLGPAAASGWRVPQWGRFGGRLNFEASGGRTFTPVTLGGSPSPRLPVCLHGAIFRAGSSTVPAAGRHPPPAFVSALCLPSLSSDHTAPPASPAAPCPLLCGCKPRGIDARRQCPLLTPSGAFLEVHSTVRKNTWFLNCLDALQSAKLLPRTASRRLYKTHRSGPQAAPRIS